MGIRINTMSADLVWQCVRNNSSFLKVRRCGSNKQMFTAEPNNLTNLNRFKDSGLANTKAVGLVADSVKGVHMTTKSVKRQRQVKRNLSSAKLTILHQSRQGYHQEHQGLILPCRPHQRRTHPLVQDLEIPGQVPQLQGRVNKLLRQQTLSCMIIWGLKRHSG